MSGGSGGSGQTATGSHSTGQHLPDAPVAPGRPPGEAGPGEGRVEVRERTSGGSEPRGLPSGGAVWVAGREDRSPLSPQLCCLHADMLGSLGPKEAKKAFLDFYHSFLEKTAVRGPSRARPPPPWALESHLILPTPILRRAMGRTAWAGDPLPAWPSPHRCSLRPPFLGHLGCPPSTAQSSPSPHPLSWAGSAGVCPFRCRL